LEEEREPTPKETEVVADRQEVHKGAIEDRTGEQRLVLRHHRERKKRAQVNGGSACGRITRRAHIEIKESFQILWFLKILN
jgi:hypothetical protein